MQADVGAGGAHSGFDKLAWVYRWLEYASFGPLLQRTRLQFLPAVAAAQRALVLGDGDGRFCVALLRASPRIDVTAVDASSAMLRQTARRATRTGVSARLQSVQGDATETLPRGDFDLVCTHFFLDCLSDAAVLETVEKVRRQCTRPLWLVSEFAVPRKGAARWPAWLLIRTLYAAFGALTGLRTRQLPEYASALRRHGFVLQASHARLFGLLRAELWRLDDAGEKQST